MSPGLVKDNAWPPCTRSAAAEPEWASSDQLVDVGSATQYGYCWLLVGHMTGASPAEVAIVTSDTW